jgi:large subunit ribosomal protein L18
MIQKVPRNERRLRIHRRIRKKVTGTPERPRLCVFRSLKHIYAQMIDDVRAARWRRPLRRRRVRAWPAAATWLRRREVGRLIAERAKEKGIRRVVFDRGGYLYHGRVKALADAAREAGLEF